MNSYVFVQELSAEMGMFQSIFYCAQECRPQQTSIRLVAQAYDEASNISGQYNGLQKIIPKKIGGHVIFTYCYAHTLNLVLLVATTASVQFTKLFNNLEKRYNIIKKSERFTVFLNPPK